MTIEYEACQECKGSGVRMAALGYRITGPNGRQVITGYRKEKCPRCQGSGLVNVADLIGHGSEVG